MSEQEKTQIIFDGDGNILEERKLRVLSKKEKEEAVKKFEALIRQDNSDVSELLEAYFDHYEMMEIDDLDHYGYRHYLKLYSYDDLNSFVDALEIKNNEKRWQMALGIITAASKYESWNEYQSRKPKVKEYKASMKRLGSAMRKAYKELDSDIDCEDTESTYQFYFTQALQQKISNYCKHERSVYSMSALLKEINARGFTNGFDLGLFIEIMAEVAEEQVKKPSIETGKHEEAIHTWMANIGFSWEEYSEFPLKEAKYYKDVGYVSDQMKILEDIMRPLDSKVTNSQMGHALKTYLSKKEGGLVCLDNFLR